MRNAEFHRTRKRLCQRRAQTKKTNAPEGSASACRMKKKQGISITVSIFRVKSLSEAATLCDLFSADLLLARLRL